MTEPSKKADFAAGLKSSLAEGATKAIPGAVGGAVPGGSAAIGKAAGAAGLPGAGGALGKAGGALGSAAGAGGLPGAGGMLGKTAGAAGLPGAGGGAQEAAKAAAAGAGKAAAGTAAGGPSKAKAALDTVRRSTTDPGRDQKTGSQKAGEALGTVASETVKGAVQGAAAGGVGAVPGAVKGVAMGAGKVALKSKTGKIAIAAWIVGALLPLIVSIVLVNTMVVNVGKQIFGNAGTAAQQVAADAAVGAGLTQPDTAAIMTATAKTGVQWELVAAVFRAQQGPASNPYRFTEASGVAGADLTDLGLSSKMLASKLVDGLKLQTAWRTGIDLANGASVSLTGQIQWSNTDGHRLALHDAFITALAALPVDGANNNWAEQVYSTALNWRLGLSSTNGCTNTGSSTTTSGSGTSMIVTSSTGEKVTITQPMLTNVATMVQVAKTAGLSNQAMLIATMTMAVESKWLNLASKAVPESLTYPNDGIVAGDHDSVNAFQQRAYTGAWGTPAQLMDPTYAAGMFFGLSPAGSPTNHARGLTQISGWESMAPGVAAQTVQVSAFPDRYAQWEQASSDLLAAAANIQVTGGCSLIPGGTDASNTYGPYWASMGNPEGIDPWNFYWGECVSYAAWEVRTTSKYSDFANNWRGAHFGNAYQWADAARAAGLVVNQTPAVGSVAVRLSGDNGHVAYVTRVYQTGNIDISEYNHAGKHIYSARTNLNPFTVIPTNDRFDWFIHFEQ